MHIPDGQLDPAVLGVSAVASATAVLAAARSVHVGRHRAGIALMAGAGVMVAHLVDVPVAGPYTAHLVGGTLLGIALGPWLGLIAMTAVLGAEALFLGDGGVVALGANVLTMGVAGVLVGWYVYRGARTLARHHLTHLAPDVQRVGSAVVAGFVSALASTAMLVGLGVDVALSELVPHYLAWAGLEALATGLIMAAGLGARRFLRLEHEVEGALEDAVV